MHKNVLALTMALTISASVTALATETTDFYKDLCNAKGIGTIQEYWTDELDAETIWNRGDSASASTRKGTEN